MRMYEMILDQIMTSKLTLAVRVFDDFGKDGETSGNVEVFIPDINIKAIENPSHYYNFLDLNEGTYTVAVKSEYYIYERVEHLIIPRNTVYLLSGGGHLPAGSMEAILADVTGLRDGDVLEFNDWIHSPERRTITVDADTSTNTIRWDEDPQGGLEYEYDDTLSIDIPYPENMILPVRLTPNPVYPFPPTATLLRGTVFDTNGKPISNAKLQVVGSSLSTRTINNGNFVFRFPPVQDDSSVQIKVTWASTMGELSVIETGEVRKGRTTSLQITVN